MLSGPAYRIETERLVLRGFEPRDTEILKATVDLNLAHLRPWVDWVADEPRSFDQTLEVVRRMRAQLDLGQEFTYAIFEAGEARFLGACGLRPDPNGEFAHVGYWLDARTIGRGFATEAASALVRLAFELHGYERVEIHCDADNERSAAVARRLGFAFDARLRDRRSRADGTHVDRLLFSMFSAEYLLVPARRARVVAFDGVGRSLLLDPRAPAHPRRGSAFR